MSEQTPDPHGYRVVTVEHLRDAIQAGLGPIRQELTLLRRDVDAIGKRLDAKPVQRWLVGRVTKFLDGGVPLALVAALTYGLTHYL